MTQKELSELTDQELLDEAKKSKSNAILNAFTIGLMGGVIFYGIVKNNFGFFALIPLYFIYKIIKNSNALEKELKKRNLKKD